MMPVYLITVHTYRSWGEDNPRGYVQRGEHGVKAPSVKLATARQALAKDPPVCLEPDQQQLVLEALYEVCQNRDAIPYAASCTPTHWHLLAGWMTTAPHVNAGLEPTHTLGPALTCGAQDQAAAEAKQLATSLKRVIGMKLSKHKEAIGAKWFSRGWDLTRIEEDKHFDHLIEAYLPKHRQEGGVFKTWPASKRN